MVSDVEGVRSLGGRDIEIHERWDLCLRGGGGGSDVDSSGGGGGVGGSGGSTAVGDSGESIERIVYRSGLFVCFLYFDLA